jgi:NAD(P)-dependent dehydrogenase (short-subunit alcohol dehydrogenase family)
VRIGRELCLRLADAGARVCLHYGQSRGAAEQTAGEIRASGGEAVTIQADLADPVAAADKILSAAVSAFGPAEILVNSASIFESGLLEETTRDDLERHLRINLQAPLFLCQRFAAQLGAGGPGAIVNIADWRALRPQPGHLAYTLSKSALVCLTQILAQELAPRIRANAIAPGAILPPAGMSPSQFDKLGQFIPLGRTGTPGDIADAVLFLLRNDYVNGEVLHVTGGQQLQARQADG